MAARFQSACQIAWKSSLFIFVNLFTETGKNEESAAGENLEPNAANAEVRITFFTVWFLTLCLWSSGGSHNGLMEDRYPH